MTHTLIRIASVFVQRSRTGPVGLAARTLNSGPLTFGAVAALVPFAFAQSRELYLRIVGEADVVRAAFGLGGVLLLCATLHAWNYHILNRRIDELYPDHARIGIDTRLKDVRNFNALFCAILPLAGVVAGQFALLFEISATRLRIGWSDQALVDHLDAMTWGLILLLAVTLFLGWLLLLLLHLYRGTQLLALSWAIGPATLLSPLLPEGELLAIARLVGPLCVYALVAIGLIALVRFLSNLVRFALLAGLVPVILFINRWLYGSRALIAASGVGAFVLVAALAAGYLLPDSVDQIRIKSTQTIASGEAATPSFDDKFKHWLAARGLPGQPEAARTKPYPIFVVAAQGGGIYAASLAMTFLSSLQDQCPNFARHVFGISAVSGGAIGASIFQGLAEDKGNFACLDVPRNHLSTIAHGIAGDDHLSSLLLSTPLDWLSKLTGLQTTERANALRHSFVTSYQRRAGSLKDGLTTGFDDHWSPNALTFKPALLLNTTSVETGERVAFAPFSLLKVGAGTLSSFSDISRTLLLTARTRDRLKQTTVIDAAVSSARFPGILPAWPLLHNGLVTESGETRQLNFVDGGYADSSGASTASDVLERLRQIIETMELGKRVSLHLILLTDTDTTIDLARAQGNNFIDTWAPVTALMNVRQLTARRAVAQAVAELRERNVGVVTLEIDHRIFQLPLGWTLSPTSNLLIQRMVASDRPCLARQDPRTLTSEMISPPPTTAFEDLVRRNACERARIIDLLTR